LKPERRLILLLAVWTLLCLAACIWRSMIPIALAVLGLLAALAAFDAWRGRRLPAPEVQRIAPHALALGIWCDVHLEVRGNESKTIACDLFDHHPPHGEARGLPRDISLAPGEAKRITYRFRATQRGDAEFRGVELLQRSPLGLWRMRKWIELLLPVKVYPDFSSVQRYAILAVENAMGSLGVRKRPKRGEGLELLQLREYRRGDSLRQIDWKATSRRDRIISRQYEDERNQQVVFLLDCAWRMRAVDNGEAHFDRALNSLLLLTYVAVRQGDAAGLMTLGGERWLPPQRGPLAMRAMLNAVYDLDTRGTHPDFTRGATELMARQRRRALIVVLSNLRDEDSDEAEQATRLLRRRHLVLFASLRETSLDAAIEAPVTDFQSALRTAATHRFIKARSAAHDRLRGRGVATLDVTPEALPAAIVNRYLDIKRSGAL